ncbi:hypothetical protein HYZ05_01855 [Candidatus Daviesbacteria bacterium]|nr:hypothetical protein [Candidatus Daviesbacteria bacterium]
MKTLRDRLLILSLVLLAVRLTISQLPSFEFDESAYRFWTQRLVENGLSRFYSNDVFTNNPLGIFYFFWLIGWVKEIIFPQINYLSSNFDFFLKIPANIADILSGVIIYLLIRKQVTQKWALLGILAYVLNPAIFFNSSIWGQYDGLSTLFLLLATYAILIKKMPELSTCFMAVAWIIKPQAIAFIPVLALTIFTHSKPFRYLTSVISFFIISILLYFPFFPQNPIFGLFYVNTNSASLFNCTTCFAFNFWQLFGNWKNDLGTFLNIPFIVWGIILYAASLMIILLRKPLFIKFQPPDFYLTSTISILAFFTFLTRMHERYLFPVFAFLLIAALIKNSVKLKIIYLILSIIHFVNLWYVYYYYNYVYPDPQFSSFIIYKFLNANYNLFTLFNLIIFAILILIYFKSSYTKESRV